MGSINLTTAAALYKHLYADKLEVAVYDECRTFGWLPKADTFEGDQEELPVRYSGTRAAGDWLVSQAGKTAPQYKKFIVTRGELYAHLSITCKAIAASRSKKGAFREAMKEAVDSATYGIGRGMAYNIWGTGAGSCGVVGSETGSTITLSNIRTATNFEVGDVVEASATDDYSARLAGKLTVSHVNRDTGVLTFTADVGTTIVGIAATNYLFKEGELNPFGGIFGWIPKADVTVTSATWFSVDRTPDVVRLAGSRIDGGGAGMEDIIYEAIAKNRDNGGRGNTLILNTYDMARFQKEASSKVVIPIKTDNPKFGLKGIGFATGDGDVVLMSDKDCPQGHAILTARDSWVFKHLRPCPHLADEDGNKFRFENGADNIEGWYRVWGNLFCKRPVDSTSIKW